MGSAPLLSLSMHKQRVVRRSEMRETKRYDLECFYEKLKVLWPQRFDFQKLTDVLEIYLKNAKQYIPSKDTIDGRIYRGDLTSQSMISHYRSDEKRLVVYEGSFESSFFTDLNGAVRHSLIIRLCNGQFLYSKHKELGGSDDHDALNIQLSAEEIQRNFSGLAKFASDWLDTSQFQTAVLYSYDDSCIEACFQCEHHIIKVLFEAKSPLSKIQWHDNIEFLPLF